MPAPEFMVVTGDFPNGTQTETIIDNVLGVKLPVVPGDRQP